MFTDWNNPFRRDGVYWLERAMADYELKRARRKRKRPQRLTKAQFRYMVMRDLGMTQEYE